MPLTRYFTLLLIKTAVILKPKKMLLNDTCELKKRQLNTKNINEIATFAFSRSMRTNIDKYERNAISTTRMQR